MKNPRSGHSLFSGMIPGLTTKTVRGDCLHILFCKGLGHLLGGIIHYLCWHDGDGVVQSVAPDKRLGALFQALTKEYQRQGTPTRVTNLRMGIICDAQSPHKSFANLDLKASETKHFLDAFPVCKELLDPTSPHENAMLQATHCMSDIVAIFDDASAFLTEAQWKAAMSLEKGFSDNFEFLSTWALEEWRTLFNKVIKHHTMQHLVGNSKFLNPRVHWTFASEDFVGKKIILTASVSPGISSIRLNAKVAPQVQNPTPFPAYKRGDAGSSHTCGTLRKVRGR